MPTKPKKSRRRVPVLAPAELDLGASCTIEDHHPCDVRVALGLARDIAEQAGLQSYGKLQAIQDEGVVSMPEAERVLRRWAKEVQRAPQVTAEQRDWATIVIEEVWPAK